MELKTGHKQTEVGVIPSDWDVKMLGDIIHGVEYGSSSKSKKDGSVPVLRMGNIQNGKIDFSDLVFSEDEKEIRKYLLNKDDVLFNRTNTVDLVGKTGIYKDEMPAIFAGYLIRIKIKDDLLNADYLNYWLNTPTAKKYGNSVLSIAVGQANINGAKLKTYPIALPILSEQNAIATALSDTDQYITHLEKLIAKKRNIKQGAMQELLKPKEGWVVKKLGELCSRVTTGKLDANAMKEDGDFRFYTCAKKYFSIDHYAFDDEALLVSGNGENVGYVHYFMGKFNAYQRTYVLTGFNQSIHFVKLYLDKFLPSRIESEVNSGNTPYIKMGTLTEMNIYLPNMDTQTRIATILSDMDAEIATLETKLSKTKSIKQGMMQQLLTGKIRLIN